MFCYTLRGDVSVYVTQLQYALTAPSLGPICRPLTARTRQFGSFAKPANPSSAKGSMRMSCYEAMHIA